MATLHFDEIESKSKNKKGQWYPRWRIYLGQGIKSPKPHTYPSILIWKRADTEAKKKQNKKNKNLIVEIGKELDLKYARAAYKDGVTESATLKEHLGKMIDLKREKSLATINSHKQLYKVLEAFCSDLGLNFNMDLNRVNIEFVDKFRVWMVDVVKYKGDTSYKYFSMFGSALKKAKQYGRLYTNPYELDISYPKRSNNKMVYLTGNEVQKMKYTPFKYEQIKNAFLFMCHTGIRQGDCCEMIWEDLPIIDGQIKINVKTQKGKTDIYFKLPKVVMEFLPKRMSDADKVFPNLRFDDDNNNRLRMWAYKSGVKKHITPHTARHSFAFWMLSENNTPLYTVSKLLGHTTSRTTEEHYGHLSTVSLDKAMTKAFGN